MRSMVPSHVALRLKFPQIKASKNTLMATEREKKVRF